MYRIDAQATRQRINGRPCRGGAEVDAFSREGKLGLAWAPGERAAIKARAVRRDRRTVRIALGQLARLAG
jgi:hypothetical protein